MAPRAGFEPATYRLTAGCSTVELSRNIFKQNYSGGEGGIRSVRLRLTIAPGLKLLP
jgi:hypothetical protein